MPTWDFLFRPELFWGKSTWDCLKNLIGNPVFGMYALAIG